MITALVPYNPARAPEPDAGRGLHFRHGWLVSTPSARHVRWLAPWIQSVIADVWNLALGALRQPSVRSCIGLVACATLVFWLTLHDPVWLFIDWLAGIAPLIGVWLEVEPLTETREVGA